MITYEEAIFWCVMSAVFGASVGMLALALVAAGGRR